MCVGLIIKTYQAMVEVDEYVPEYHEKNRVVIVIVVRMQVLSEPR